MEFLQLTDCFLHSNLSGISLMIFMYFLCLTQLQIYTSFFFLQVNFNMFFQSIQFSWHRNIFLFFNSYFMDIKYNEDYNQFYVVKIVNTNGIHRLGSKYN